MLTAKLIPICDNILDKDTINNECNYTNDMKITDILNGWVESDSDCWCIISKYKCHKEPVVEYNSFHLEPNEIIHSGNTKSPNYVQSLTKIIGNRNREYIGEHTTEYLDLIEYCNVYVYGNDTIMMKVFKENDVWNWKYYGSKKAN